MAEPTIQTAVILAAGLGSRLNGGNGGPYGDEFAPAKDWLRLADEMWDASTAPLPGDEPAIPAIWGTDAVHGHTNVVGATIFPHNIGLGAARDADLMRRIGAATAAEIAVTGIDWNFSPTVAVAQDDRWGRTYESYSEDPVIAAERIDPHVFHRTEVLDGRIRWRRGQAAVDLRVVQDLASSAVGIRHAEVVRDLRSENDQAILAIANAIQ